jgi:hypothetical protein
MEKSPLQFPLKEPEVCPFCGCKTVQFLKDGGAYCSRVACQWDSEVEEEKLPELPELKKEE